MNESPIQDSRFDSQKAGWYCCCRSESLRPQGGASRQGITIDIVPLAPAYKAGLAGHLPVKSTLFSASDIRQIFGRA